MNPEIIEKQIFLDQISHAEALAMLLRFFGRAESVSDTAYRFTKEGLFVIIHVHDNNLISIGENNLIEEYTAKLSEDVKNNLIDNQKEIIGRVIGFCKQRITGCYRYSDVFQLLPIPADAPQAIESYADHPFIMEYKYVSSPDMIIDFSRRAEKALFYFRLINIFVSPRLRLPGDISQKVWTLRFDGGTPSDYSQVGYIFRGYNAVQGVFTDAKDMQPIEKRSAAKYFSQLGIVMESFCLPEGIDRMLDQARALSLTDKEKLSRSCAWVHQADEVWQSSQSLSYIGYVNALEALIDEDKDPTKCDACGKIYEGPTKKFYRFLEKFVPLIQDYPKEKSRLYRVRSALSHGSKVLERDLGQGNSMMSKRVEDETNLHRNLHNIAITAIRNWVLMK